MVPMASSPRLLMKYVRNIRSPSRKNTLWPCHSWTPKSTSKLSVMVYQGISQPIRVFRSICWRAASHSCCDTIGGVFIARCPFGFSLFLSLLVAISFLLCFLKQTETSRSENFSELADAQCQNSSRGSGSGDDHCCTCD